VTDLPAIVIDASAFLGLFLPDETGKEMESFIKHLIRGNGQMLVPILFWYEILNGLVVSLRRGRITEEELDSVEADIAVLPIVSDQMPAPFIRKRVRDFARRYRLSIYDAAYLELAARYRLRLKTLDKHLLQLKDDFDFID